MKNNIFAFTIQVVLAGGMTTGTAQAQIGVPAPPSVSQPQGPTLQETTAFIAQKFAESIAQEKQDGVNSRKIQFFAAFDACRMTLFKTGNYSDSGYPEFRKNGLRFMSVAVVDLENLQPTAARVTDFPGNVQADSGLSIPTIGRQKFVLKMSPGVGQYRESPRLASVAFTPDEIRYWTQRTQEEDQKYENNTSLEVSLSSEELAERLKRAFIHASKLCVQQRATAKAAQPQKKELF